MSLPVRVVATQDEDEPVAVATELEVEPIVVLLYGARLEEGITATAVDCATETGVSEGVAMADEEAARDVAIDSYGELEDVT